MNKEVDEEVVKIVVYPKTRSILLEFKHGEPDKWIRSDHMVIRLEYGVEE